MTFAFAQNFAFDRGDRRDFTSTLQSIAVEVRRELLKDFDLFARRMRLHYIYYGKEREPHPFHVKSDWNPPVQPSVALGTPGRGGTWVFFGWVCAAQDSKLAPRFKFP